MSKFWAAIRRLLGKKDDGEKKTDREPNDVQKVTNRLHPYDTVEIGEDGSGVTVDAQKKRVPRPYDEVGPPDSDGKMDVK